MAIRMFLHFHYKKENEKKEDKDDDDECERWVLTVKVEHVCVFLCNENPQVVAITIKPLVKTAQYVILILVLSTLSGNNLNDRIMCKQVKNY